MWFSDELLKQPFCLKIALIADSERVRTRADSCELVKARIHPNMLYITRHVEICFSTVPFDADIFLLIVPADTLFFMKLLKLV